MIRVRNLSKSYIRNGIRSVIFQDLSFDIETGESVAILGRNGAGKSTLMRLLGGIDQPDSGRIESDQRISWPVGLAGGFQGSLSARENVKFVSRIYAHPDLIQQKVKFVEEFADIGSNFDRPFKFYSNGMKARVTFGLSMAFDFDVYLMDEVTGVGDQAFREKAKQVVQWRAQQASFLMVSHNLWGLKLHCDRALVLHEGQITSHSSLDEAIEIHRQHLGVADGLAAGRPGKGPGGRSEGRKADGGRGGGKGRREGTAELPRRHHGDPGNEVDSATADQPVSGAGPAQEGQRRRGQRKPKQVRQGRQRRPPIPEPNMNLEERA